MLWRRLYGVLRVSNCRRKSPTSTSNSSIKGSIKRKPRPFSRTELSGTAQFYIPGSDNVSATASKCPTAGFHSQVIAFMRMLPLEETLNTALRLALSSWLYTPL